MLIPSPPEIVKRIISGHSADLRKFTSAGVPCSKLNSVDYECTIHWEESAYEAFFVMRA